MTDKFRIKTLECPGAVNCPNPASHEVLSVKNTSYGSFCKEHAKQKKKALEALYKDLNSSELRRPYD